MMDRKGLVLAAMALALLAFGCGEKESSSFSVVKTELAAGDVNCPYGGTKVELRVDGSVWEEQTKYVCREQGGGSGEPRVVTMQTTEEPAGEHCQNGGTKVEVLVDGVVQPSQTTYVCAEASSTSDIAVRVTVAMSGSMCDYSGFKVEIMKAGVLQNERTVYACAPYPNALMTVETSEEPPGEHCAEGGIKIETLLGTTIQTSLTKYSCEPSAPLPEPECPIGQAPDNSGTCAYVMEFIGIPAGSYIVGHEVDGVSEGKEMSFSTFSIGQVPVTVGQYRNCIAAGACSMSNIYSAAPSIACSMDPGDPDEPDEDMPINCISRSGATEFCAWVGGRLPTEGEWEYAAMHNGSGAPAKTYPWGNDAPSHCETANYYNDVMMLFCDLNAETTSMLGPSPVGAYFSGNSALDLADMAGNVLEWTNSIFVSGAQTLGILKGGSWSLDASYLEITSRWGALPDDMGAEDGSGGFGFRCVR